MVFLTLKHIALAIVGPLCTFITLSCSLAVDPVYSPDFIKRGLFYNIFSALLVPAGTIAAALCRGGINPANPYCWKAILTTGFIAVAKGIAQTFEGADKIEDMGAFLNNTGLADHGFMHYEAIVTGNATHNGWSVWRDMYQGEKFLIAKATHSDGSTVNVHYSPAGKYHGITASHVPANSTNTTISTISKRQGCGDCLEQDSNSGALMTYAWDNDEISDEYNESDNSDFGSTMAGKIQSATDFNGGIYCMNVEKWQDNYSHSLGGVLGLTPTDYSFQDGELEAYTSSCNGNAQYWQGTSY